jgi:putative transposase
MRYAAAGGYTPAEQERRERVRLEAAERFARGDPSSAIARDLRVTERSVQSWRAAWNSGGAGALASRGPVSAERLTRAQWRGIEAALDAGPAAAGYADDQRWTLERIAALIAARTRVRYSLRGVSKLLARHGYSWQVPVRRSAARDEEAIATWKREAWPLVEQPPASSAPASVSSTKQARR